MLKTIFIAVTIPLVGAFPSGAGDEQADSLKVYRVDEITVKAARIDMPLESMVLPVDVVAGDETGLSNANSAIEVMGDLPGVFIQKTGDFGQADISIRGLGDYGRRVTILMDGHPVKVGLSGNTVTSALPPASVAQIELVRTPGSVLYGSDALGGVLNIVTATPVSPFALRANATYGSYSTWKFNMLHSAKVGTFGYVVSVDRRESEGHLENSAYAGNDFSLKLIGNRSRTKFTLLAKYYDGYKEEPALATDPPDSVSETWNDFARGAVDFEVSSRHDGGKATFKLYNEFGEHEYSDGWHSRDQSRGIMAYDTRFVGENVILNAGADYRQQLGERLSPDPGEWSKYEVGLYGLTQIFIKDKAVATAGLRLNVDEISGTAPAPHLGLLYDVSDATTLRGSVSGGFRSPQIDELYMYPSSNTSLTAERLWSFEVGVTQRFGDRGRVSVSLYRMIGRDFIELVERRGHHHGFVFENVGEIDFAGAEATLVLNPHASFESKVSYAYLDPGVHTAGRPGDKLDARGTLRFQGFALLARFQYVADYYAADYREEKIDDYLVIDARISRSLASGFDGFFSVENMTDEEYDIYTEIPGGKSGLYRMPGRRFLVGVNFLIGE